VRGTQSDGDGGGKGRSRLGSSTGCVNMSSCGNEVALARTSGLVVVAGSETCASARIAMGCYAPGR
jgi:hypothetical protein